MPVGLMDITGEFAGRFEVWFKDTTGVEVCTGGPLPGCTWVQPAIASANCDMAATFHMTGDSSFNGNLFVSSCELWTMATNYDGMLQVAPSIPVSGRVTDRSAGNGSNAAPSWQSWTAFELQLGNGSGNAMRSYIGCPVVLGGQPPLFGGILQRSASEGWGVLQVWLENTPILQCDSATVYLHNFQVELRQPWRSTTTLQSEREPRLRSLGGRDRLAQRERLPEPLGRLHAPDGG